MTYFVVVLVGVAFGYALRYAQQEAQKAQDKFDVFDEVPDTWIDDYRRWNERRS